ncbi:MAG: class I SAM-dependent methyltransferase [Cyanobacteria bacterium REEB67]|nr:class I SAM-dependent methyltransferase [Cyanobacteria bacterium REEB67]
MPVESPAADWYKNFFAGAALKLWRGANPQEATEAEVGFLIDLLDLPEGGSVLDLPCGNGRLALPLALAGYTVTGIEYAAEFVQEAAAGAEDLRKLQEEAGESLSGSAEFIEGDMLQLALHKKFDGAFCLGNSFGYFDRPGTKRFLQVVADHLKPGARFVLDSSMVAETFLVNGGEREWVRVGEMLMLVENKYDLADSRVDSEYIFIENGKSEARTATHWIYTTGELCKMLEEAGFGDFELFGSTDGEPFALGSERLLLMACKG